MTSMHLSTISQRVLREVAIMLGGKGKWCLITLPPRVLCKLPVVEGYRVFRSGSL